MEHASTRQGKFKGTAWLFLKFVDRLTGEESQRAISAQTVEIGAANLFGFSAGFARTDRGDRVSDRRDHRYPVL